MRKSAGKSGLKQCCDFSGSCSASRQEGREGKQGSDRSGKAIKVSGFFLAERERLLHSLKQILHFGSSPMYEFYLIVWTEKAEKMRSLGHVNFMKMLTWKKLRKY